MSKENKTLRKKYKFIRKEPTVFYASYKGAVNFHNVVCKKNGYFERQSSAMFWSDYYYGRWEIINVDTIIFHYFDNRKEEGYDTISVFKKNKLCNDGDGNNFPSTLETNVLDTAKHYKMEHCVMYNRLF
ncbi:MAG: hypothetical protein ACKVQB_09570 [Bacteroidia bacterium]